MCSYAHFAPPLKVIIVLVSEIWRKIVLTASQVQQNFTSCLMQGVVSGTYDPIVLNE